MPEDTLEVGVDYVLLQHNLNSAGLFVLEQLEQSSCFEFFGEAEFKLADLLSL